MAKAQLDGADDRRQLLTKEVLYTVLEGALRLLHPFMPFVTEEAWQYLTGRVNGNDDSTIMYGTYPQPETSLLDETAERTIAVVRDIIVGIRNVRTEYKVEPVKFIGATIVSPDAASLAEQQSLIVRLARVADDDVEFVPSLDPRPKLAATVVIGTVEIFIPLAGMIDLAAERQRLGRELELARADVERRQGRLADESFTQKAPAAIVQRERDNLAAAEAQLARLEHRLRDYSE
jgi:valyl-tRNA synthetase